MTLEASGVSGGVSWQWAVCWSKNWRLGRWVAVEICMWGGCMTDKTGDSYGVTLQMEETVHQRMF